MHLQRFAAVLGLCLFLVTVSQAQTPKKEPAGLKVGEKVPTFTLKDQQGKDRPLASLLEKGKVTAFVFHRSIRW